MNSLKVSFLLVLMFASGYQAHGQIRLGSSEKEINFRQAPGMNSQVLSTIGSSNLLVILPREPQNGFVEVFDIESSSFGFVYESLITVTDTLYFREQHFSERSGEGSEGVITLELINNTGHSLFLWINRNIYTLDPHEKKELVFTDEEITYFSSAPGLYPVFGREILKKGSTYKWNFPLITIAGNALTRDTLRLDITPVEKKIVTDTVYVFSSRVDTIALQPVKTDTSKVARDVNPLDLAQSKYKVQFRGSVRVNGYYDFTGMNSTEGFMPYEIPVGEENIEGLSSVYVGARQSRLGMEGTASTKVGAIKTYIEVDFASKSESLWRLRHAYAEWNFFKLGYSWSTFMDNASLPTTVDFEGPNSSLSKRHGIIRYERKYGRNSIAGISFESPTSDYYNPADSLIPDKNKQGNFDIAGRYKYFRGQSHFQVAGIFRRIEYLDQTKMDILYGWGILLSTNISLTSKSTISGQYSFGSGIANYYVGFVGRQLDAVYDQGSETMRLKTIRGGFITYSFIFNPSWRFSFTGGTSTIMGYEFESDDTFKSSKYFASNIFYNPIETIRLGIELTTGSRTNIDEQTGRSTRISLLASFDF
ncbi:MAG: DcaP family trimeric outer membrane transporter [Bacteroidales bacterium]|nr:DcaP family trimeric outer membrane transporter [Bacteroidales bacterium]